MKKIIVSALLVCSLITFTTPMIARADAQVDAQFSLIQTIISDISALFSQLATKFSLLGTEIANLKILVDSKLGGGSSGGGGGSGSLMTNLEHYYPLVSNSNDAVGSNNGTDTSISHSSLGATFGGSPSKIALAPISMPTDLTISALIKYNYTGGTQPIFGDSNATITSFWYLYVTDHQLATVWETPAGSRGYEINDGLIDGNQHCVSMTQIGTNAPVFYVDGNLVGSHAGENQGSNAKPSGQGSAIGELGGANFLFWNGSIKNVGIWSRALSASEQSELNSNGCGVSI